jgi:hypothetical protein
MDEILQAVEPVESAVKSAVRRTRKPKANHEVKLYLPVPSTANGLPNTALMSSASRTKYVALGLVKHEVKSKTDNGRPVLEDKSLGHLAHFVLAAADAWTGGTGNGSDGSALYTAEHWAKVKSALPQIVDYDVVIQTSQAGAARYRLSIPELIGQVQARAKTISACISAFGTNKSNKVRKSNRESVISL